MKISIKKFSFLFLSILFVLVGGLFFHLDVFNASAEEEPTTISSTQEFVNYFSQAENASKSYKLTSNLNFEDVDLTNLYSNWTNFKGTFDGDGHTISNLTLSASSVNYGLFPSIDGATIKNLKIDGDVKYVLSGTPRNVGILVGYASSSSKIENCEIGGLVEGEYSHVYTTNEENEFSFQVNNPINFGGIASNLNFSFIKNCVAYFQTNLILTREVNDELNVGGIAGSMEGGEIALSACFSKISVNANFANVSANVGGLVGQVMVSESARIFNNAFSGTFVVNNSNAAVGNILGKITIKPALIAFNYWASDSEFGGYGVQTQSFDWDKNNKPAYINRELFATQENWHDYESARWNLDSVWNWKNGGLHLQLFQTFKYTLASGDRVENDKFGVLDLNSDKTFIERPGGEYAFGQDVVIELSYMPEFYGYYRLVEIRSDNDDMMNLANVQEKTENERLSGYTITLPANDKTEGAYTFKFDAIPFKCYIEVAKVEGEDDYRGSVRLGGGSAGPSIPFDLVKGSTRDIEAVENDRFGLDYWELQMLNKQGEWVKNANYRSTARIISIIFGRGDFIEAFKLVAHFTDENRIRIQFHENSTTSTITQIRFNQEVYDSETPIKIAPNSTNVELEITVVAGYEFNSSALISFMQNRCEAEDKNMVDNIIRSAPIQNEDGSTTYRFSRINMAVLSKSLGNGNTFTFELYTAVQTDENEGNLLWLWITLPIVASLGLAGGLIAFFLIRRRNTLRRLNGGDDNNLTGTSKKVKKTKVKEVDYKDYYS